MKNLTLKERRFIELYTNSGNTATFGNATRSYAGAGYTAKNDNVAGVLAHRLLRKDKIRFYMEEKMAEFELNMNKHIKTLDDKITNLAQEGRISREELQGYRLLGEFAGKIGAKGVTNIVTLKQEVQDGKPCPVCGADNNPIFGDIKLDLNRLIAKPVIDTSVEAMQKKAKTG